MNSTELAKILNAFYEKGKKSKNINAMILCFGIKYAEEINANKIRPEDIIAQSNLAETKYARELRKGIKLSEFVTLKSDVI